MSLALYWEVKRHGPAQLISDAVTVSMTQLRRHLLPAGCRSRPLVLHPETGSKCWWDLNQPHPDDQGISSKTQNKLQRGSGWSETFVVPYPFDKDDLGLALDPASNWPFHGVWTLLMSIPKTGRTRASSTTFPQDTAERVGNGDMKAEAHPQLVHIPPQVLGLRGSWTLSWINVTLVCLSSGLQCLGGSQWGGVFFVTCNPGAIRLYCLAICCLHHKPWFFLPANGNIQLLLLISSKRETDIWWASIMYQPRCYTETQMSRCISPSGAQSSWKRPEVGILFQHGALHQGLLFSFDI